MNLFDDVTGTVGNTPLIKLRAASQETGCLILGKAEFLNPGQSVKDRAAVYIIEDAKKRGKLREGGLIVEGTAGNTGIGLTMIGQALGYDSVIVIPDTQSQEKKDMLHLLGAKVVEVPAVPYKNPDNFVRYSERLAAVLNETSPKGAIWANQFDNIVNRQAHLETTAREIWAQTDGKVDGFCCAAGSGGTIGGVSMGLKELNSDIKIALADPHGAALYSYYTTGELKSKGSSIAEGIGQGRVTKNLEDVEIDMAFRISDEVGIKIVFELLRREGLCLGLSSGINVAGAIKLAKQLGPGHTVVTMLCDSGTRYQSRLFNPVFLAKKDLPVPSWLKTQDLAIPEVFEHTSKV